MIFHDQADDITRNVQQLDQASLDAGFQVHAIHTAPLIRKEGHYFNWSVQDRVSVFRKIYYFARKCPFTYKTFSFKKRETGSDINLVLKMSNQLGIFIREHLQYFTSYERIVIYYDNGQHQVSSVLASVFGALFNQGVEIRNVAPIDYKLFQVADFICTIELFALKRESNMISKSEDMFFSKKKREFKDILKTIRAKLIK